MGPRWSSDTVVPCPLTSNFWFVESDVGGSASGGDLLSLLSLFCSCGSVDGIVVAEAAMLGADGDDEVDERDRSVEDGRNDLVV
jgi:hypothetical protein